MRKIILVVLFVVIALYFGMQRFAFKTGADKEGGYRIVMVDKKTGELTNLWGK